jgi:hypothetical protein
VSAQAKPISEVVKEFEQTLENLRPSTRRVYVAAAKTGGSAGVPNLMGPKQRRNTMPLDQ